MKHLAKVLNFHVLASTLSYLMQSPSMNELTFPETMEELELPEQITRACFFKSMNGHEKVISTSK